MGNETKRRHPVRPAKAGAEQDTRARSSSGSDSMHPARPAKAAAEQAPTRGFDPQKHQELLDKGLREYDSIWQSLAKK